jgi:hypothetical protein
MQTPLSKRRLLQWVVVFSFAVAQFAVKNASWNPWLFHLPLSVILPMVKYLPRWWSDTLWVVLSRLWLHSLSLSLFWFGWKWHNSSLKVLNFLYNVINMVAIYHLGYSYLDFDLLKNIFFHYSGKECTHIWQQLCSNPLSLHNQETLETYNILLLFRCSLFHM